MRIILTITTSILITIGILYAHTLLIPYINDVAKVLAGMLGG